MNPHSFGYADYCMYADYRIYADYGIYADYHISVGNRIYVDKLHNGKCILQSIINFTNLVEILGSHVHDCLIGFLKW